MTRLKGTEIFIESSESEALITILERKIRDLKRPKSDYVQKELQEEILALKGLLPIILTETTLLFSEITKALISKIHEAVKMDANAIVMVIPLHESADEIFKVATVNPHRNNPMEGLEIGIEANGRILKEVQL
jgi:hypothetical protein